MLVGSWEKIGIFLEMQRHHGMNFSKITHTKLLAVVFQYFHKNMRGPDVVPP
jgi:hypothetical protein